MVHKFDFDHMDKLDNPERREMLPPQDILLSLGLKSGDRLLDVGAGVGYFSLPASAIVGPSGSVVATDISADMLAELQSRADQSLHENIELVLSGEYRFGVEQSHFDFVLISTVLHEVSNRIDFLDEALTALKPGGKLWVIEWGNATKAFGPPASERLAMHEVSELLAVMGFCEVKSWNYNEFFYIVTGMRDNA